MRKEEYDMYISVTRLHLKGKRKLLSFSFHTIKSIIQSKKAKGLKFSSVNKEGWETYWTLTVWESKEHMKVYRNNGNHLKAMKISRNIADKLELINWEAEAIPTWNECKDRLNKKFGRIE
ncbi:hypothetical protein MKY37_20330 [Psychrobacillus sp. FSL K6-2836]|uniref:DUF3291 domain-containing protein n=1 Tax=Psychrobacillus sp. FSL K6-2836 TaxID=2921548 RepID=UPI0030FB227B